MRVPRSVCLDGKGNNVEGPGPSPPISADHMWAPASVLRPASGRPLVNLGCGAGRHVGLRAGVSFWRNRHIDESANESAKLEDIKRAQMQR